MIPFVKGSALVPMGSRVLQEATATVEQYRQPAGSVGK